MRNHLVDTSDMTAVIQQCENASRDAASTYDKSSLVAGVICVCGNDAQISY
jgi:hypothetical protein